MPNFEETYRVLEVRNNNLTIWKKGRRVTVNIDQVRVYHPRHSDTNSFDSTNETLHEGKGSSNGSSRSNPVKSRRSRKPSGDEPRVKPRASCFSKIFRWFDPLTMTRSLFPWARRKNLLLTQKDRHLRDPDRWLSGSGSGQMALQAEPFIDVPVGSTVFGGRDEVKVIHRETNHFWIFAILRNASNREFDRGWLTTMVKHIDMGEKG
ncbi:uncharacterized protein TNCV_2043471 [Trichonephila clavipes]|nr:uncharacterized protein TNCV_2043471 [Trichonephila clavipes]